LEPTWVIAANTLDSKEPLETNLEKPTQEIDAQPRPPMHMIQADFLRLNVKFEWVNSIKNGAADFIQ
jgi:hypothetical protein